jgi:hypothetical protein
MKKKRWVEREVIPAVHDNDLVDFLQRKKPGSDLLISQNMSFGPNFSNNAFHHMNW